MDLIERYLQAVQFWLPKAQKADIIAELSEDLRAQIEEREKGLGRTLTEAEVEKILKLRGRPVLVANRFLPQRHLIGPVLFPVYIFVLKIAMACYLVPWALTLLGRIIYSPGYRPEDLGHWFIFLGAAWAQAWSTAFGVVGIVTIFFAVLERAEAQSHFLKYWSPRKLLAVRKPNLIPRSGSSIELIANLVFLVCWSRGYGPIVLLNTDVRISLSSQWSYFYGGYLVLAAINVALATVNLTRPYWTAPRAGVRLLTNVAGSALFCWLLKANVLIGISVANVSAEQTRQVMNAINYWMGMAFPVALAVCIVILCVDVYRIVRLKSPSAGLALQAVSSH